MPNLSQIIVNDHRLGAEPMSTQLAHLFEADIYLTDADEPFIDVRAWRYLHDQIPHLNVMGARVLKFLTRLQHLLGDDMGTRANHMRRVCRVISKVVRDTSLNATCELWVTRHVLAAMSRAGVSARIVERHELDPRALGPSARRALEMDLSFLSARGLLRRVDGVFKVSEEDALSVFARCGEIARGFNLDALWADLFLGAGVDHELLEVVLSLGYSCPQPSSAKPWRNNALQASDIEASYRAFDLALGLDISGIARGMEAGIQVTPSMLSDVYPGCAAGALKIMRAVGWLESALHGDIITPLGAYAIHHIPRVASAYVGWRRWLEERDLAYRRERMMTPVRAEIFDDVSSRRAIEQFVEFDATTHGAIDHLVIDPMLAPILSSRVHTSESAPRFDDDTRALERVIAVSLFDDTPATFFELGDSVSGVTVAHNMLDAPDAWASCVQEEVGADKEITLVLGASLWPVALQGADKLEAILSAFCRRGWSLAVAFPVDASLEMLTDVGWSTRALTDVYLDTATLHAAGLEQPSPHAWQHICERAGYAILDEFTSTHNELLPFGEVDRESIPRQRSAVLIPEHRRTSLDFRAMSLAASTGEVTSRLADETAQARASRSRTGRTWIMLDVDDGDAL